MAHEPTSTTPKFLRTWQEQVAPGHVALVMVDLQNGFLHPDRWRPDGAGDGPLGPDYTPTIRNAVALLDAARAAGVLRAFVRMIGGEKYESEAMWAQRLRRMDVASPRWVEEGTWGSEWFEGLGPTAGHGELVVEKHRFSPFVDTDIDAQLRSLGIRTVVVCGVSTSGCVESTIRDAYLRDYHVVAAEDACGDATPARHEASLTKVDQTFGTVVSTRAICDVWGQAGPAAAFPPTA